MAGSAVGGEKVGSGARTGLAKRAARRLAMRRWLPALKSFLVAGGALFTQLLTRARWRWLRSLRLRVVSTTLVVSAIVVSMLGFFLMQQFTANLLNKAEVSAREQATDGLNFAKSLPGASKLPGASAEDFIYNVVGDLKSSGENPADEYGVAVGLASPGPPVYFSYASNNLPTQAMPPKLLAQFPPAGKHALVFARMPLSGPGTETTGLLFAAPFGIDSDYRLFYFFPLTQLQTELGVVLRAIALVGLALVFLLAGIAWLLTRWVVVPVVTAARGAQLLATGRLDERLVVRGNDEVAALATSFNEMAVSLQDKMRELEGLSQVQRQFVSDVSHELRTPLTTIRMAADLLFEARENLEPQASRSAELLQSQLNRFESLLADLLEISRYDANAATLDAELVDICDIVRNSADVAQQLAERRGSRIEFRLPAEPCVAEVDRRRVERILRNLLVNAVEHGEGREVVVTSAADRGRCRRRGSRSWRWLAARRGVPGL